MGIRSSLFEMGERAASAVSHGRSAFRSSGAHEVFSFGDRFAGYGERAMAPRAAERIGKLSAKARSSTFPAERLAFESKAADLRAAQGVVRPRGRGTGLPAREIPRFRAPRGRGTGLPLQPGFRGAGATIGPAERRALNGTSTVADQVRRARGTSAAARRRAKVPEGATLKRVLGGRGTGLAGRVTPGSIAGFKEADRTAMMTTRSMRNKATLSGLAKSKYGMAAAGGIGVGVVYNAGRRSTGPGATGSNPTGVYGY